MNEFLTQVLYQLRQQACSFADFSDPFLIRQLRLARVVLLLDRDSGILRAIHGVNDWAAFLRDENFIFPWQVMVIRVSFGTAEEQDVTFTMQLAKGLAPPRDKDKPS